MTPPRGDGLIQMVQQNDEKHDEAHRRLRQDFDKLEEQVNKGFESIRERITASESNIKSIEKTPIDATKLVLSTPVVVTLVIMALGIAAAVWGVRAGMEQLAEKMESAAKLQDMQNTALKTSMDDMRRRQELQQYEVQGLKEAVLTLKTVNGKGK